MANPRTIVPVAPLGVAPISPAGAPALQYHGGPVIEAVQVLPIFWGAQWQTGTNAPIITAINDFFNAVLTSSLMEMLSEYSTPSTQIKHGSLLSSVIKSDTEPGSGSQVTDGQIQTALQGWISAQDGTVVQPTENTLYFIYLPSGVTASLPDSDGTDTDISCAATNKATNTKGMCGYHSSYVKGSTVYYAVIPLDIGTCINCSAYGASQIERLTVVSSHELCEAITNPDGTGWFDPNTNNEIGDICAPPPAGAGGIFTIGNAVVQAEWSNSRCGCLGTDGNPLVAYKGFTVGSAINNVDSTPKAVACCEFHQQLFLFWKANDSSSSIYFNQSSDGQNWAPGKVIPTGDTTSAAPACCVFNERIFAFWQANDPSNRIIFSSSPTGQTNSWSPGQKINGTDHTPHAPAACVYCNQLYLFWKAGDPSNSIYFSAYNDTKNQQAWPPGKTINSLDHTPMPPSACVFAEQLLVFWKADDSSNLIYHSVLNG